MAALQTVLPIRRPLVDCAAVSAILDKREDVVLSLIEEGKIAHAFDIARPGKSRSCVRVFVPSVSDYLEGIQAPRDLAAVLRTVFPAAGETVTAARVASRLNCSSTHVYDLIRSKCLTPLHGRRYRRQTLPITKASLFGFLESRRLP